MPHTPSNTPNTILQQYNILTSFDENLSTTGDYGIGSIKRRDVASNVAMYKPYNNALDTIIQLSGAFKEIQQLKYEWFEEDELLPGEATATAGPAGTSATDDFTIDGTNPEKDAKIFRVYDRIRYVNDADGNWAYAMVTAVDNAANTITVQALNSGNLAVQSTTNRLIQRMDSLRGSDMNYDPQPRSALPRMYNTHVRTITHEASYTPRFANTDNYIDLISRMETKLYGELRRSRELGHLYGASFETSIQDNTGHDDKLYVTDGLYNLIDAFNPNQLDTTGTGGGDFTAFKSSLNSFIEHNFGAESGGPDIRPMFISGRFASLLSQAYEDKQRFYDNEFVAGVRCMRFEHNLGVIDFIHLPIFEYQHPIPNGSLKQSAPKAVGMMLPVDQCVERLVFKGEGPSSETFKQKGGDRVEYMRVETTEGIALKLKQYCATLEEA